MQQPRMKGQHRDDVKKLVPDQGVGRLNLGNERDASIIPAFQPLSLLNATVEALTANLSAHNTK